MNTNISIKGYTIKNRIGKGGCGAVYLVYKNNKYYAMKKITDLTIEEIAKYQKILNILTRIKSDYVIKYYDWFAVKDCLYIIMEYGGISDLKKFINEQKHLIEESIIKDIILQICLGLKEIHKNKLVHRDLTPDNIFMDDNNKIKIGDFGVSEILTTNHNFTKSQVGKHHYFAPEIEKGENYNNKVDIYALGCIIYELLTLNIYYNVKNENATIDKDIYNPNWQNLINSTLNDDYNKRPTIGEIYNYIKNEINNKNEIICFYNKKDKNKIMILHDFKNDFFEKNNKESYRKAKNNINGKNIEIYINNKRIKFDFEYESDEIGLIEIKFKINKLLTSTAFMFYACSSLKSINFSSFNTKNVTDMSYMFSNCQFLVSLDLSSFNTNNVTDMNHMFYNCCSLKSVVLSSFDTNNVINMCHMFCECVSLESLNISSFKTKNVTNISHMFFNCSSLKSLNLISFQTNKVSDMSAMFSFCSSLKSIDLSSFNTNIVTNMSYMFYSCSSLKSLDLSSFDVNNVTDMSNMFSYCCSLKSLDLSSFNIKKFTKRYQFFKGCTYLKQQNVKIKLHEKILLFNT